LYHSKIVGFKNIIIFDDSSTSTKTLSLYKKYNKKIIILTIPENIHYDHLHNTYTFRYVYDLVKKHCLFFTLIDTDEFLCWNNKNKLQSHGFTKELKKYKHFESISLIWIFNYFYKNIPKELEYITHFNIQKNKIKKGIVTGKSIFKNTKKVGLITHNINIENHTILPVFFFYT